MSNAAFISLITNYTSLHQTNSIFCRWTGPKQRLFIFGSQYRPMGKKKTAKNITLTGNRLHGKVPTNIWGKTKLQLQDQ